MNENGLNLGRAEGNKTPRKKHTPSTIQADTLFNFMTKLEYLIWAIKNKRLAPRYCDEDLGYLKIPDLKKIAFPMKCFCDINMHKLGVHLEWYGYYGLAFSKEWGMHKGIQPVQYINAQSNLKKDFVKAFKAAMSVEEQGEAAPQTKMQNFLLHELMYYKPYEGWMTNRNTNKRTRKCFTDECEWRFIPDVTCAGFIQVYYDDQIINAGRLVDLSNALANVVEVAISFDYNDLKYIIIEKNEDLLVLLDEINGMDISDGEKQVLISKIIIWENSKGDF